jgi:hypothetical protein
VRARTRLGVAVVVATCLGVLLLGADATDDAQPASDVASPSTLAALPASPTPALVIEKPAPLFPARYLSRWSTVRRSTVAHAAAAARSPVVARLSTTTSDGTAEVLSVLRARTGADGRLWVEVRLPVLPNNSVGWVLRGSLGAYETVTTHLVVDRRALRATLFRAGVRVFSAPIGIGAPASPTPAGQFTIRDRLTQYASPFYGPLAFGTTARSAVLTDWPDGGFIGIHGTNAPQLLPGRVSHGCIRLRNRDIVRLAALMPIGTPLTIR